MLLSEQWNVVTTVMFERYTCHYHYFLFSMYCAAEYMFYIQHRRRAEIYKLFYLNIRRELRILFRRSIPIHIVDHESRWSTSCRTFHKMWEIIRYTAHYKIHSSPQPFNRFSLSVLSCTMAVSPQPEETLNYTLDTRLGWNEEDFVLLLSSTFTVKDSRIRRLPLAQ